MQIRRHSGHVLVGGQPADDVGQVRSVEQREDARQGPFDADRRHTADGRSVGGAPGVAGRRLSGLGLRRGLTIVLLWVVAASMFGPAPPAVGEASYGPQWPDGYRARASFWLDGAVATPPALSTWGHDRLDTWVIGIDGAVWHHVASPAGTLWEPLGGRSVSPPAAASWGGNRLDVFVRGLDGALWQRTYDGGWGPWTSLGGILVAAPAVVASAPGQLDVTGTGVDGAVWHRAFRAGGWGPWQSLGGIAVGAPAVSSWRFDRLDVFVRGIDDALWHRYAVGGSWSPWESIGGILAGSPAATALVSRVLPPGSSQVETLFVGAPGVDGLVYWNVFHGAGYQPGFAGWLGWMASPLGSTSEVAVTNLDSQEVVVAFTDDDGSVGEILVSAPWALFPPWLPGPQ